MELQTLGSSPFTNTFSARVCGLCVHSESLVLGVDSGMIQINQKKRVKKKSQKILYPFAVEKDNRKETDLKC